MLISEIEQMLQCVHNPKADIGPYNATRLTPAMLLTGRLHDRLGLDQTPPYLDFYFYPTKSQGGVLVFDGIRARVDDDFFTILKQDSSVFAVGYNQHKILKATKETGELFEDLKTSFLYHGRY